MVTRARKLELIDWAATTQEFGYADHGELAPNSPVLVTCSACTLPSLRTTMASMRDRRGKPYVPLCKSCQTKRTWQDCAGFRELQSERQSAAMKQVWQRDGYRENAAAKASENSKRLWRDDAFRAKVTAGVERAHAADDGYRRENLRLLAALRAAMTPEQRAAALAASTAATQTDEFRAATSRRSVDLWQDSDFRARTVAANRLSWESPARHMAAAMALANQPRISSLQTTLYRALDHLGVPYHREGDATVIGRYAFDCLIPKCGKMVKHLLIECQGEYWHSLPQAAARDRGKFTYVDRHFPDYEIMYLWEHEFSTQGRVVARLSAKLGLAAGGVVCKPADLTVTEVDRTEAKQFFDAYHYIGGSRGGRCWGAKLAGELVACVLYAPPIRQTVAGQFGTDVKVTELARLCASPKIECRNLMSWLIAATLPKGQLVVAYADTTAGHSGAVYKACGFRLHHEVQPDYWYVDADGFVMHKRTLYGRAVKMQMKEAEYAAKHGYQKRWGGKKRCFVREA